ncbi:site-specific DNA-methyltransferase [Bifidobacterium longum]|uniref:site-specific DNA-methyltransferase n=2 Tax=Bifidobacterium longum TaxID=216816 RepID=UPI00095171E8|nr:site-specific DNA-methyltransferase [Bifidobacterium longum]OLR97075.1 DNA methylase family protein [Bifidobacterium longum subsp. longum]TCF66972.1 DNA restriction-modification system, DNA methylase [Bifidobacterium longum subsp. longum]
MTDEATKLPLESANIVNENITKLGQLFPEIMADGKIDFDKLREVLGDSVDDGQERYAFTWPGKRDAIRQSQTPSTATLRPQKDKSVDWDTTKNLYIEGDNLEVLKLLQRSYHGKVKMIYIDPPYNTGNDFVYKDSFSDSLDNYKQQTGQASSANPETDGRYHSNWCNMMYPRLRLARELLSEDGVIFISIDDHELHTLRKIGEELFGEGCFVADISWQRTYSPRNDAQGIPTEVEHILVWSKSPNWNPNKLERSVDMDNSYQSPDGDDRLWASGDAAAPGAATHHGMVYAIQHPITGEMLYPSNGRHWTFGQNEMLRIMREWSDYKLKNIEDNAKRAEICGTTVDKVSSDIKAIVLAEPNEATFAEAQKRYDNGKWPRLYFTSKGKGGIRCKRYVDAVGGRSATNYWPYSECGHTDEAKKEIKKLFDGQSPFDTPKPTRLIRRMLDIATDENSLVLDFFSGSGTTADAVMQANAKDGGKRRCILVQLPEKTSGNYTDLCSVGEERIRRAGQEIKTEVEEANRQPELDGEPKRVPDIGFRVLSLDSSNIQPESEAQSGTWTADALYEDVIKEGRSKEDVLFEVMLKWGLDLSLPIEPLKLDSYTCWSVAKGELICCMDEGLTVQVLEQIAGLEDRPRRVLILDSVLDDTLKLNAESIFNRAAADGDEIELRTV